MQKNKFLILLILCATGCTQKNEAPTLLSQLLKSEDKSIPVLERSLASGANKCVGDLFTVETLKAQIKEEEKKFKAGEKVSGSWKHLELSKLSIPQANFLKTYGNEIGDVKNPDSIDYSGCDTVPCIYNKIYGKEEHVAGYVHYLWYLKFGHMLSADNSVPYFVSRYTGKYPTRIETYNGKKYELKDFLYNDEELYGLWRLSLMLDKSHAHLTNLRETQRVPRGSDIENENSSVCGQASSGGWIILKDSCLRINKDDGYLYEAVTHELSHQLDFFRRQGRESETKEYLELTGFSIEEYLDDNKRTQRRWKLPPRPQLVTFYGSTSPAESFAEDLAYFRHDGDTTKRKLKETHYQYISDRFYQKRKFDSPSFFGSWFGANMNVIGQKTFKAVLDCSQSSAKFKTTYLTQADFNKKILPSMLNCLSMQAETISSELKAEISIQELEGCKSVQSNSVEWNKSLKSIFTAQVETYLNEMEKDKSYLANIQKFYNDLSDNSMALDSYVQCYEEADEEACFAQESFKRAKDKARELGISETQADELGNVYVNYHAYSAVKQAASLAYLKFVRSQEETIRLIAESSWEGCRNISHNDIQPPTGSLFQVNSGYMISSFYNCLNAQYPQMVKDIVREISNKGQRTQNAKEEVILSKEVVPHVNKVLDSFYVSSRENEFKDAKEFIQNDKGALRAKVLAGFSWVNDVLDSSKLKLDCQREAMKEMSFLPLFHLKKDLFSEFVNENVCQNIEATSEYKGWLDHSQEEFAAKAYSTLEGNIVQKADAIALSCLKTYPADTNLNRIKYKKDREECLSSAWIKTEQEELKKFESDPMVVKFKIDVNGYKTKLESNRRRLQLKVIKEKF